MTVLQDPPSRADGVFFDMVLQALLRSVRGGAWGFNNTLVSFKNNTLDDDACQIVVLHISENHTKNMSGMFVIRSKGNPEDRRWECGIEYKNGRLDATNHYGNEQEMIQQLTLAKIAGWLD